MKTVGEMKNKGNKYFIFSIGNEIYGIRVREEMEAVNIAEMSKLPDFPNYIKGIVNLEGKSVPVMDIRRRIPGGGTESGARSGIILIDENLVSFGLIVDVVKESAGTDETDASPPPAMMSNDNITIGFIKGIGSAEDNNLLIIDCLKKTESQ